MLTNIKGGRNQTNSATPVQSEGLNKSSDFSAENGMSIKAQKAIRTSLFTSPYLTVERQLSWLEISRLRNAVVLSATACDC